MGLLDAINDELGSLEDLCEGGFARGSQLYTPFSTPPFRQAALPLRTRLTLRIRRPSRPATPETRNRAMPRT